jgi:4-hydroxy-tetrahydrodipicolinate synthase
VPYLPLINFEQQARVALAIRKECLRERGWIRDAGVRAPSGVFPEHLRHAMEVHLREADVALKMGTPLSRTGSL